MKILLIRFSSIGDIVLTTPVIRVLKTQLQTEVHFITKEKYTPLLAHNPYIDKIYTIQRKVSEVLADLKKEQYDYIIDLHRNFRSFQIKWNLKGSAHSFEKLNWEKWLMVNFKINQLPNIHIVERYLKSVRPLGVINDGKGLDYFLPPKMKAINWPKFVSHQEISKWIHSTEPVYNNRQWQQSYIAFAIGAAHQTKRLPIDKIIAICKIIDAPVVLLGGPSEAEEGQAIAVVSGSHILNTCGKLSLHQSAAVIQQASKVLTHDTGMMHIAAAFQKEIISIWGNTIPAFGMYPYYPKGMQQNTIVEVKDLSCRPCSKIGYQKCPKGHFQCMQAISIKEIISKVIP